MPARNSIFSKWNSLGARMVAVGIILLWAGVLNAQEDRRDRPDHPYSNGDGNGNVEDREESRENGVSAGGKWTEYRTEDL